MKQARGERERSAAAPLAQASIARNKSRGHASLDTVAVALSQSGPGVEILARAMDRLSRSVRRICRDLGLTADAPSNPRTVIPAAPSHPPSSPSLPGRGSG